MNSFSRAARRSILQSLESRRLFTFALIDDDFANHGYLSVAKNMAADAVPTHSEMTRLDDGRLILTDSKQIRFLKADGAPDKTRGTNGIVNLNSKFAVVDAAVDPKSGRIAVAIQRFGLTDINLYDAKGKYLGFASTVGTPGNVSSVAFAPDGKVILAAMTTIYPDGDEGRGDSSVTIKRFTPTLELDTTFAGGTVTRGISNFDFEDSPRATPMLNSVDVDADGNVIFVESHRDIISDDNLEVSQGRTYARRYFSNGDFDGSYNTPESEARPLLAWDANDGNFIDPTITDVLLTSDGNIYAVAKEKVGVHAKATTQSVQLIGTGGQFDLVTGISEDRDLGTPSLTLTDSGYIYVSTRDGGRVTQLYRFIKNGDAVTLDDDYSNFGSFATTTSDLGNVDLSPGINGGAFLTGVGRNVDGTRD